MNPVPLFLLPLIPTHCLSLLSLTPHYFSLIPLHPLHHYLSPSFLLSHPLPLLPLNPPPRYLSPSPSFSLPLFLWHPHYRSPFFLSILLTTSLPHSYPSSSLPLSLLPLSIYSFSGEKNEYGGKNEYVTPSQKYSRKQDGRRQLV